MRRLIAKAGLFIAALGALVTSVAAQQPNSTDGSLVIGGVDGPPWPIALPVNTATWGVPLTLEFSGPPNQPFLLVHAPAGMLPAGASTQYGLLDLDPSLGLVTLGLFTTNGIGELNASVPVNSSFAGVVVNLQCFMAKPGSSAGAVLTAATKLSFVHNPMNAVYVSQSRGKAGNSGTSGAPFLTLAEGINAAFIAGSPYPEVLVEEGDYDEPTGFSFREGVNITGGYDAFFQGTIAGVKSRVFVGTGRALAKQIHTQPTEIRNLDLRAGDAVTPEEASIALEVRSCTNVLKFTDCQFVAGRGGDGIPGQDGNPVQGGKNGSNATISGWIGGVGGQGYPNGGGKGGNGIAGVKGQDGDNGAGPAGAGGTGGQPTACATADNGGHGKDGGNGAGGAGGQPSVGGDVDFSGNWYASKGFNGAFGAPGGGGGGGGAGGGRFCIAQPGLGGGGGGGGGASGNGGTGGGNGGASFAVFTFDTQSVFVSCIFAAGTGGDGAPAGNGGCGGTGGIGATDGWSPCCQEGNGGRGGDGGRGGSGGGGAGGSGGPSYGLRAAGNTGTPDISVGNTFLLGAGGTGAPGGIGGGCGSVGGNGAAGLPGPVGTTSIGP